MAVSLQDLLKELEGVTDEDGNPITLDGPEADFIKEHFDEVSELEQPDEEEEPEEFSEEETSNEEGSPDPFVEDESDVSTETVDNVFCPRGKGGGVDPTCYARDSGGKGEWIRPEGNEPVAAGTKSLVQSKVTASFKIASVGRGELSYDDVKDWSGVERQTIAREAIYALNNFKSVDGFQVRSSNGKLAALVAYHKLSPRELKKDPEMGSRAIDIEYLASSRPGGGTRLVAEVCNLAASKGIGVQLSALPNAETYYKKLGMKETKGQGADLSRYEFDSKQAGDFSNKYFGSSAAKTTTNVSNADGDNFIDEVIAAEPEDGAFATKAKGTENVFCPTGPGGGKDPSCGGTSGGSTWTKVGYTIERRPSSVMHDEKAADKAWLKSKAKEADTALRKEGFVKGDKEVVGSKSEKLGRSSAYSPTDKVTRTSYSHSDGREALLETRENKYHGLSVVVKVTPPPSAAESTTTSNVFCPTGEGGGKDPTCGKGDTGSGGTGKHEGINADGSFDRKHWEGMSMGDRRDAWAKLPTSVRDKAADPAVSIPKRIKENLEGVDDPPNTGNAHTDIEQRLKQMKDRITDDSAAKIQTTAKEYNDTLKAAGVNPKAARDMALEATDYLAAQEIEATRRTLGDHGISHIKGNIDMANKVMEAVPGEDLPSTKAAVMAANIYHDAGYLTEPSQVFLDEGHPRWGAQAYSQLQHGKVAEALGHSTADEVQHMIRTHDQTSMDWEGDIAASAVRVADNAALFSREKLPPVFKHVPGNVQVLKDLSAKKVSLDEARAKMNENIEGSEHPRRIKDAMLDAVKEVSPFTGKFTLGMLGGEVNRFSWTGQGVRIHLRESAAVTELNKLGDFGQRQFGKLAETYGTSPDKFKKSLPFKFKDARGRVLLEGVVDQELAGNRTSNQEGSIHPFAQGGSDTYIEGRVPWYALLSGNAFCKTGKGGGVDPSCKVGGSKGPRKLTEKDHDTIRHIEASQRQIARSITERDPTAKPSEWVFAEHLRSAFGTTQKQLESLAKKGVIEIKPSGGMGPQVRIVREKSSPFAFVDKSRPTETSWLLPEYKNEPYSVKARKILADALKEYRRSGKKGKAIILAGDVREGRVGITVHNAFCPTGKGGGVDPTCGKGKSGGVSEEESTRRLMETFGKRGTSLARPMVMLGDVPVQEDDFSTYLENKGKEWKAAKLPEDIERGVPKECFKNATKLMLSHEDLDYVEGIAYASNTPKDFGFLHAWCVKKDGTVVDNTWDKPEDARYIGVKYNRKKYIKHIFKTEMFGVFGGDSETARKVLKKGGL
jgi:hypothetical protein